MTIENHSKFDNHTRIKATGKKVENFDQRYLLFLIRTFKNYEHKLCVYMLRTHSRKALLL